MKRPLTQVERKMCREGDTREEITEERIRLKRPDGIAIKMPTDTKLGEFVSLEFKKMSDVTDQYVTQSKRLPEDRYVSIRSTLSNTSHQQQ